MANARFVWDNAAVAATIVASAEASGYPATYLNNRARWKPWRSTITTGNQTVTATFTSRLVQAVAIVNYLAHTGGGTIKAEYWTGAAFAAFDGGTGLFTLPASNRTRLAILWFPAGRTTTQIRITFTNTVAVNMAVELGALVIGPYFEPTIGLTDDLGFDYVDPSDLVQTPGGQEIANERQKYLGLNTVFEYLTAADKNTFLTMFDTVGITRPLVYAVDPTNVDQIVYGRFLQLPLRHQVIDQWTIQLPFKEVR